MQVTLKVVASDDDRYWDPDKVELEVNISSNVDEVAIQSATGALLYFKKLIQQAVEERIANRKEAEAIAKEEAKLAEVAAALEEEADEDKA